MAESSKSITEAELRGLTPEERVAKMMRRAKRKILLRPKTGPKKIKKRKQKVIRYTKSIMLNADYRQAIAQMLGIPSYDMKSLKEVNFRPLRDIFKQLMELQKFGKLTTKKYTTEKYIPEKKIPPFPLENTNI